MEILGVVSTYLILTAIIYNITEGFSIHDVAIGVGVFVAHICTILYTLPIVSVLINDKSHKSDVDATPNQKEDIK